jgi:hypothetical protein
VLFFVRSIRFDPLSLGLGAPAAMSSDALAVYCFSSLVGKFSHTSLGPDPSAMTVQPFGDLIVYLLGLPTARAMIDRSVTDAAAVPSIIMQRMLGTGSAGLALAS